jgi:hypothetical protein
MADTQTDYGVAHFYGLYDTRTYMTVQSDSISTTYKLDVEVADENGRVITDRLDDIYKELTIEGVILAEGVIPLIGSRFNYHDTDWILKSLDNKGTNKDFRKLTVKGVKYQEIDTAPQ